MPSSASKRVRPEPHGPVHHGNDDDFVFRTCGDVLPILQIDRRLARGTRGRQCLDQHGSLRRGTVCILRSDLLGGLGLGIGHGFGTKRPDVDRFGTQAAGQIHVERSPDGFLTRFVSGQIEQFHRDLGGRIGLQTVTFHHCDQRIVAAHQTGAAYPTDLRMGECDPAGPRLFGTGTVHDRIERTLHLTVRAVAAEDATVRRTRQNHMQLVLHVGVGADLGKTGNRTFTPHSMRRAWDSNNSPESAKVPCTGGAANGKNRLGS